MTLDLGYSNYMVVKGLELYEPLSVKLLRCGELLICIISALLYAFKELDPQWVHMEE